MSIESGRDNIIQKPKKQEQLQLSPDQQEKLQREKEEVLMLSKIQRQEISKESISAYLSKFHNIDLSKYPQDIQKKFIEEIQTVFSEFKKFDEKMISWLRDIREDMSAWLENWESNEYYRNMILSNKISQKVVLLEESLKTILGEKIKVWNREYNKEDYNHLKQNITNLDQSNWIWVFAKIDAEGWNNLKKVFSDEIKKVVDKSNPKYSLITSDLTRLSQVIWDKWFENLKQVKLINWQTVDLEELYKDYNKNYKTFAEKNKIFEFWNKQIASSQKWFWFTEKKFWVWYDTIKEAYADKLVDIEKMWMADLVIMLRVLSWALPFWVTNILGWYDDLKQANAWVNFDWSIQWGGENLMSYFTWVLWLSVVWWWVATIAKWPKLAKVISTLWKVMERLSKAWDLSELAKNEKIMNVLEAIKWKIPWVEDLVSKIKKTRSYSENINTNALSDKQKVKIQKLNRFIDDLIWKADPKTLSMSKEEIKALWDKSKKLILEISASDKFSPEILDFLVNVKWVLSDKLWWMNLKSLTHILESVVDWWRIPENTKIQETLKKFWNISQADFFAITAIFHDLDKNFMPAQFLPDLEAALKWHNLTSHQLDSANLFKNLSSQSDIWKSLENFFEKSWLKKLPNWNEILQKLVELYRNLLQFIESKWITDSRKKEQLMDLMFETIKWHAANTEFIQVDSARGWAKALNQVQSMLKEVSTKEDVKKIMLQYLDSSQKIPFEEALKRSSSVEEMTEISKKFILQRYIKINIWKEVPINQIDLKDFDKLVWGLNSTNKNSELKQVLKWWNLSDVEKIISQKTTDLKENKWLMNKYLHGEISGGNEEVRFAFNLNDIIWYIKPNSEWFIKLIWLEWWPQHGFDLLIASPMNSMLATLSELKAKSNIPEYKHMYENWMKNVQILMNWYKAKLNTPFVYSKGMPEYLSWKEFQGKTFWQVYEILSNSWPKFWDNLNDRTKFNEQFVKELAQIKQYFAWEFKKTCAWLKWVDNIYN